MPDFMAADPLTALFQVIIIDLVLAGDNAIVIGLAAAGLPQEQRTKAILIGIIAATVLRIGSSWMKDHWSQGSRLKLPCFRNFLL